MDEFSFTEKEKAEGNYHKMDLTFTNINYKYYNINYKRSHSSEAGIFGPNLSQ